jgi:hypothetical protein
VDAHLTTYQMVKTLSIVEPKITVDVSGESFGSDVGKFRLGEIVQELIKMMMH